MKSGGKISPPNIPSNIWGSEWIAFMRFFPGKSTFSWRGGSFTGVGGRVVVLFVSRVDLWQKFRGILSGKRSKIDIFRRNLGRFCIGWLYYVAPPFLKFHLFHRKSYYIISFLLLSFATILASQLWTLCAKRRSGTVRGPYQSSYAQHFLIHFLSL